MTALLVWPVALQPGAWLPPIWNEASWRVRPPIDTKNGYAEFVEFVLGFLRTIDRGLLTPGPFAPQVYRTEPLQSWPIYLSFGASSVSMAYAGDFDNYQLVTQWQPGDVARWAGNYRNEENGARLRVIAEDGKLSTELMGMKLPLLPGREEEFTAGRGAISVPHTDGKHLCVLHQNVHSKNQSNLRT